MKKKLKVKKAFAGKMMRAAPAQARRVIRPGFTLPKGGLPRPINFPPELINPVRPGVQQQGLAGFVLSKDPNMFSTTPPRPGTVIDPGRQPGIYQQGGPPRDPNMFSTTPPRPDIQFGVQPLPAAPGFGAPMQPVPAMKKGGAVRGGRAEIKGLRKAKLS
jgi:hypothetical protein